MGALQEKRRCTSSVIRAAVVLLGAAAAFGADVTSFQSLSVDINDLDWERAGAFEFVWDTVELSMKVSNPQGESPADGNVPILTISGLVDIVDTNNLATIDISSVGIWEVLDENGQNLGVPTTEASYLRAYEEYAWGWDETGVSFLPQRWFPFTITFELPPDPNGALPSSISSVGGYIYALFGDTVLNVDVPFDPNFGCLDVEESPDLVICVNPATFPPDPPEFGDPRRPPTLYNYHTVVKSKTGTQILGVRGPGCHRFTDYFDYAVIRTSLFDSQGNFEFVFETQSVSAGGVTVDGRCGPAQNPTYAYCSGTASQARGDNWDMIRHVVVCQPVEVKIPFVLTNIPVPNMPATRKD